MKTTLKLKALAAFTVALLISTVSFAQKKAPASPRDSTMGVVRGAHISINYGSPSVRGRKIFGDSKEGKFLQPYGEVWRAGANEATFFTTDKDITIEGKKLPAGRYSFFATPGAKEWTIIFNSAAAPGMWGTTEKGANDDATKDVLVAKVTAKTAPMTERLKYVITKTGFELIWDTTSVPVTIK